MAVAQSFNCATAELKRCGALGSRRPHSYGQSVFLLPAEDDQSAHLRPHIMLLLFVLFTTVS